MSKPKSLITRIFVRLFQILPVVLVVMVGVPVISMAYTEISKVLGLRTIPISVMGTGSMYPSLFWESSEGGPEDESKKLVEEYRTTPNLYHFYAGLQIFGRTYLHRTIGYGDMVSFKNDQTVKILEENNQDISNGFIKRVIAVPGDTVELRDGFVYKNSQLLSEPYIASPRSTYGGETLKDCKRLTIPEGHYFVLGDNRKVSTDSRSELGLIQEGDIEFILPYAEQQLYRSLWRDTSEDSKLLGQPTLSAADFLSLVNTERAAKKLAKLSLSPGLTKSSTLRADKLLHDENTTFGMQQAVDQVGYSNIVLGEFVSFGHYTAKELLENLLYNQSTAKQILNSDYSDLGISDVSRDVGGCPTQIIVGHLGGYIPASYDQATVSSWTKLRDNLISIIPSWEKAIDYNGVDQAKLSELLTLLRRRLALAQEIIATMDKKEWLSDDQQARIKSDNLDSTKAESLSNELNRQ